MLKPIGRLTLFDSIVKQMISLIREGKWEQGSLIPCESALAKQLGVSRNCVREVMKTLYFSGVVEPKPGKGTFLSENAIRNLKNIEIFKRISTTTSLKELMEIRLLIETQAAYWAAEKRSDEDILELKSILQDNHNFVKPDIDIHAKFHDKIVEISANQLLIQIYNLIREEIAIQRKEYKNWPIKKLLKFAEQHECILSSIDKGRPGRARDLMQKHIIDSFIYYIDDKY